VSKCLRSAVTKKEMLPNRTLVSGNPWYFVGKPTGDGHRTVTLEPNVGAPGGKKADGRRRAGPAMRRFGADAGPDRGDAAGTGGGFPGGPQGPVSAADPRSPGPVGTADPQDPLPTPDPQDPSALPIPRTHCRPPIPRTRRHCRTPIPRTRC